MRKQRLKSNVKDCILVFVRSPVVGKVKTRLGKTLSAETVLQIYKAFGKDVTETVKNHAEHIRIYFYPPEGKDAVMSWLGDEFHYLPQRGDHLGDRMQNAFADTFSDGFYRVVLVGTDIPDLPGSIIDQAFKKLSRHPSVVGPAIDGGYYLIGFKKKDFLTRVFDDIPWGTGHVLDKTLSIFKSANHNLHLLKSWQDTDNCEDLEALKKRIDRRETTARHTADILKTIQLR
jgi:rSAM/selenodomain-associated transferase 1